MGLGARVNEMGSVRKGLVTREGLVSGGNQWPEASKSNRAIEE